MLLCAKWFCKQAVSEFTPAAPAENDEEEDYHEMLQYMYGGAREEEEADEYYEVKAALDPLPNPRPEERSAEVVTRWRG
eukprot:4079581-Prymnesium_polylepis.1